MGVPFGTNKIDYIGLRTSEIEQIIAQVDINTIYDNRYAGHMNEQERLAALQLLIKDAIINLAEKEFDTKEHVSDAPDALVEAIRDTIVTGMKIRNAERGGGQVISLGAARLQHKTGQYVQRVEDLLERLSDSQWREVFNRFKPEVQATINFYIDRHENIESVFFRFAGVAAIDKLIKEGKELTFTQEEFYDALKAMAQDVSLDRDTNQIVIKNDFTDITSTPTPYSFSAVPGMYHESAAFYDQSKPPNVTFTREEAAPKGANVENEFTARGKAILVEIGELSNRGMKSSIAGKLRAANVPANTIPNLVEAMLQGFAEQVAKDEKARIDAGGGPFNTTELQQQLRERIEQAQYGGPDGHIR